jgi:hypothetical protein
MRRFKIAGLILAGLLAIAPTVFAHGFGGGGGGFHGGGFGGFHGGGGHSIGHFGGGHYGWQGGYHGGHWRGGRYWYGGYPYLGGYYGWGYPYGFGYDYNDYYDSDLYPYADDQTPEAVTTAPSTSTVVAVQQKLARLGYYHGQIDGIAGAETQKAIRRFQSTDKISVTGRIDDQTLRALQIS